MDLNWLVVFDIETGGKNVRTCQLLEIAAVVVDPIRLQPVEDSYWSSLVRPEDEATLEPEAMAVNRLDIGELRQAPPVKVVLTAFEQHVNRFYKGKAKSSFKAPYPAGKNIKGFDIPVLTRYFERFKMLDKDGDPRMFNPKWVFDVEDDLFRWFGQTAVLPNLTMDTVRGHFGIPKEDGHRALTDVRHTAWLVCKFLKLYRTAVKQISFAGAWNGGVV